MKKSVITAMLAALVVFLCACGECEHEYSAANCTQAATCSKCGETNGEALGHQWKDASCTEKETCERCGETQGDALGHDWAEATCETPKTCIRCKITEGEALGHTWKDADCTNPKTCEVCNATEGTSLGHTIESWKVTTKATCTEEGEESGICTVCGETDTRAVAKDEHKPSDWKVTVAATKENPGTHVKECKVCGAVIEEEDFTLTAEEIEKEYKSKCKSISYSNLERNPGEYKDQYITMTGTVFQVCSEAKSAFYYSMYFVKSGSDLYAVYVDNYGTGSRILEDDRITVWGTVGDLYTYETVRGNSNTIPTIYAEYYK